MKSDLLKYRIEYDQWFRESSLHENGEVREVLDLLTEKGLTYEKDGALWYKASENGGEKDEVLIRANGTPPILPQTSHTTATNSAAALTAASTFGAPTTTAMWPV